MYPRNSEVVDAEVEFLCCSFTKRSLKGNFKSAVSSVALGGCWTCLVLDRVGLCGFLKVMLRRVGCSISRVSFRYRRQSIQ
ncbi:hypothetical protein OUZ56_025153 [Daphnia magna]|uniref:Uncharacterized protein n=1 Tax=Daphnia magna TaxID=35525 RepID=A0ABQ9ZJ00_9CRUS|nr:hypothetical protein OUZ56_025153 [Daphnia magna]